MGSYETGQSDAAGLFYRIPNAFWVNLGLCILTDTAFDHLYSLIYVRCESINPPPSPPEDPWADGMVAKNKTLTYSPRWFQYMYTIFQLVPTLATVEDISQTTVCKRAYEAAHDCILDDVQKHLLGKQRDLIPTLGAEGNPAGALKDRLIDIFHQGEPVTSCIPHTIHTIVSLAGGPLHGITWYIALSTACFLAQYGTLYLGAPGYTTMAVHAMAPVLLCPLYTRWRHATILAGRASNSENLDSKHRVGLWKSFRVTALPTFIFAAAGALRGSLSFA